MTTRTRRRRAYYIPWGCLVSVVAFIMLLIVFFSIPVAASRTFGRPADTLNMLQRFQYSLSLLMYGDLVTRPADAAGGDLAFTVYEGEQAAAIAERLQQVGLVRSSGAFRAYLIYRGLDTGLQAGEYTLSKSLSPIQIAERLQDATPTQVKFVVLPGWRLEEIAAALPTSGLAISPEAFMAAARSRHPNVDGVPSGATAEGFIYPDTYLLPRTTQVNELLDVMMARFDQAMSAQMRAGFARKGLTIYEAVTLASILQREVVKEDEQPMIASVFYNRLASNMPLQTDPTIQYTLGYDGNTASWWKAPLSADDLQIDSPYNTYTNRGLPPGPIASPSLSALQAVASPVETNFLFFRARCDGSGRHAFAASYDEHLANECP